MNHKLQIILSMVIFGTIGLFRRWIDQPSGLIAMSRGLAGALVLFLAYALRGKKTGKTALKPVLLLLVLSGIMMGFNWIFLFEAYRYTSIAVATVCYYMAPLFVLAASPLILKEKLSLKQVLCILAALAGVVLVSGLPGGGADSIGALRGIIFGLMAAVLYAGVVLINRKIGSMDAMIKTMIQLFSAGAVLIPYVLLAERNAVKPFGGLSLVMLLIVCVVHTGAAYLLYFGSMEYLETHTIALLSYIDPVVAVILSAVLLREKFGIPELIGCVLVIGAAILSEQ